MLRCEPIQEPRVLENIITKRNNESLMAHPKGLAETSIDNCEPDVIIYVDE